MCWVAWPPLNKHKHDWRHASGAAETSKPHSTRQGPCDGEWSNHLQWWHPYSWHSWSWRLWRNQESYQVTKHKWHLTRTAASHVWKSWLNCPLQLFCWLTWLESCLLLLWSCSHLSLTGYVQACKSPWLLNFSSLDLLVIAQGTNIVASVFFSKHMFVQATTICIASYAKPCTHCPSWTLGSIYV